MFCWLIIRDNIFQLHLRTLLRTFIKKGCKMRTITATEARKNIYKLIDKTTDDSEPIQITGKRSNAVLISEEDWRSIQETLYLMSIPGMRESIVKGMKEPVENLSSKVVW